MRVGFVDTEGNGLLPDITKMWCAHVKVKDSDEVRSFTPDTIDQLPRYLDTFDTLVGHNVVCYDLAVLRKLFGWEYKGTVVDTLLMSRLQRPNRLAPRGCTSGPHSVEAWGLRFGCHKQVHEDWSQFSAAMLSRCEQDVAIQIRIYDYLIEEGKGEGWDNAHKLVAKMYHYLQRQEEYGFYVDQDHIEWCLSTLTRWMDRIDRALLPRLPLVVEIGEAKKAGEYGWVKKPFKKDGSYAEAVRRYFNSGVHDDAVYDSNPIGCDFLGAGRVWGVFSRVSFRPVDLDKSSEVKAFLLAEGWEPAEWNTDAKGNRTSPKLNKDDPFEGIKGRMGKLIAKRVQCKQRRGTIEGWKQVIRPDGRIAPGVAGIASTGRLRHKTVVNVPGSDAFFGKQMRAIFAAALGKVLVGVDSKGNQMRQLASRMAELDGVGDEEFTHAVLSGSKDKGDDLHSLNQRRAKTATRTLAKNFFYGCILFGAGDPKTAKILGTTKDKAKSLKAEYFAEMPLLKRLIEEKTKEWKATAQTYWNKDWGRMEYRNGYIKGLDGRPILVESEHAILAYLLQSDEAIQMAVAYVMAHKWMEAAGYRWGTDWGMVLWMHDEFQMEVDPSIADDANEIMCRAIAWSGEYLGCKIPHAGDGVIGANWKETH